MTGTTRAPGVATVVLAAGSGHRLRAVHAGPKWLAPIDGSRVIADLHLDAIDAASGTERGPMLVVTGFQHRTVRERVRATPWRVLHNDRHDQLDNWYSLALALRHLRRSGWRGNVLVLNSDLVLPVPWVADFIRELSSAPGTSLMAVDRLRPLADEAMKVALDTTDHVTQLGKRGVVAPTGEYIGLMGLSRDDVEVLLRVLGELEAAAFDGWYEDALVHAVRDAGMSVRAWFTPTTAWVEVDDEADLLRARSLAVTGVAS